MVLSGIKVKDDLISIRHFAFYRINEGESNADYNADKYLCSFSKLIQYWRQIWNSRTNGTTNPQFPFGFVQVSVIKNF